MYFHDKTDNFRYEEYILSNRRLVFIDGTVYYHCRRQTLREDFALELTVSSAGNNDNDSFFTMMQSFNPAPTSVFDFTLDNEKLYNILTSFVHSIGSYSNRELYRMDDILDAFHSVLEVLCIRSFTDVYCGIPELIFDWILLFQPGSGNDLKERSGFPSWSWCGWVGGVSMNGAPIDEFIDFMTKSKFLEWFIPDEHSFGGLKYLLTKWPPLQYDLHHISVSPNDKWFWSRLRYTYCKKTHSALDQIPRRHKVRHLQDLQTFGEGELRRRRQTDLRGELWTWGVWCNFRLAARSRSRKPRDPDALARIDDRVAWGLYDANGVWSGFFYPRPNLAEILNGKVLVGDLLLHSSKAFDNEKSSRVLVEHAQLVQARGLSAETYSKDHANHSLKLAWESVQRVRALTLSDDQDSARQPCLERFAWLMESEWEFTNVLEFVKTDDLQADYCLGSGWILRHALSHVRRPGLIWKQRMLL